MQEVRHLPPRRGPSPDPARLAPWCQILNLQTREKYIPTVEKPPTLGCFVTAAQADEDGWRRLWGDNILEKRLHFKNYCCYIIIRLFLVIFISHFL